jgi:hypothetical protein
MLAGFHSCVTVGRTTVMQANYDRVTRPWPLWQHILERAAQRAISLEDLQRLHSWVVTEP